MSSFGNFISKINSNIILRNIILALCAIVVFIFMSSILLNIFTRHNTSEAIPDLSGITVSQAKKIARKSSLKIEVNDSLFVPTYQGGIILDQIPKPGTQVKPGRRVFVTINSYSQKKIKVPYVAGYSLRQAKNNLEVAGLEIEQLIFREDMATNNVLEQRYNGQKIERSNNLEIEQGSGITLVVGMRADEPSPSVPKVVGFPLKEAKSRIWEAGMNVGKIEYDENITLMNRNEAKVYFQSPEQGIRTTAGSHVSIKLSIDSDKIEEGSKTSDKNAKRIIQTQDAEE